MMASKKKVFFCFHYERDFLRAERVWTAWKELGGQALGMCDKKSWEDVKKKPQQDIQTWIDDQIRKADVCVVLVGRNTANQKWCRYAIARSHQTKKGLFGIYIHNIKDEIGSTDDHGDLSFGRLDSGGRHAMYFWELYHAYDWVDEKGDKNFQVWIDRAIEQATKPPSDEYK